MPQYVISASKFRTYLSPTLDIVERGQDVHVRRRGKTFVISRLFDADDTDELTLTRKDGTPLDATRTQTEVPAAKPAPKNIKTVPTTNWGA